MADKKTVIVMPHNHFDPSWRRCFDRKAKLGDTQVASYAEIEKQIIDRWLAYDQPFTEGQAALLRKYVEKRPENKAALSAMAKARKLACPLTGETVQDTNLPAPEGLVRNFLCALPFYRELAGDDHDGYALTWAEDSFGNSPNYPQIVRGVGVDTLCKITYKMPAGRIWTGLDGSKVVWSGVYGGTDYMVRSLSWTVTLTRGENDALLFHTAIDWDTASRCIKAVFPIAAMDTTALYEVPFGYTAREYDAAKVNYSDWSPNYMEYPAQNWVMKKVDGAAGVALFNRGIPGYRWIPGCFEMSLLRSPQFHFVGNEPRNYDFNDLDGLRDSGPHSFDYALLPFAVSAPAVVTAFKPAEDGDGQILRFYNPEGEAAEIGIDFGKSVCVQRCNLLEKNEGEAVQGEIFREKLRGFGIETLRIRPI